MSGFSSNKDLGNGVRPRDALGSWPDLEIGRTRFPALQHRKTNNGKTPDRSLLLKLQSFMHRRKNVSAKLCHRASHHGPQKRGNPQRDSKTAITTTQAQIKNNQYGSGGGLDHLSIRHVASI